MESKKETKEIEFAGCKLLLEKSEDYPLVRVYQEIEAEYEDGSVQREWMEITELQWIKIGW